MKLGTDGVNAGAAAFKAVGGSGFLIQTSGKIKQGEFKEPHKLMVKSPATCTSSESSQ